VLDAQALVLAAQRAEAPAAPVKPVRAPVLVIDDSLTTRMLELSILESAGYTVHAAVSGEDGWNSPSAALRAVSGRRRNAGMDGFTFIEHTRADPALRDVPAMLVTSRASPEDRRRGAEVGAQAYIVRASSRRPSFSTGCASWCKCHDSLARARG